MAKKFNITGTCIPERHYMADTSAKLSQVINMVEAGEYFTINRPRQYGKTTTLLLLSKLLGQSADYFVFSISFEGIGDAPFENEERFAQLFIELLEHRLRFANEDNLADFLLAEKSNTLSLKTLSSAITRLVQKTKKKVVLLIDEVDKSSNNQLFVSFLGMLRTKYLDQLASNDKTFHSVVLAGVHDVKNLKIKLRPDAEQKFNSPWNIAADFKVDLSLLPNEIVPMLDDYVQEQGATMDTRAMAEKLFYYTSGYPFLVSKLCKMLDEEIMPAKTESNWSEADLETAVKQLLQESNTNFDSLIINLEHNPDLYQLTYDIIIDNAPVPFNIHNPVINRGVMYGIFSNGRGLSIHNRIYRELIANYMASKTLNTMHTVPNFNYADSFGLKNNRLDMEQAMLRFQAFMKEQYSKKDRDFLERQGRLIFLAFLKPILNGKGHDFKEPQISEEQRLDVVVTFFQHKYIVELKIWRGAEAHQRGLLQLADYLEKQHLDEGYLLIFDHSGQKSWKSEWLEAKGKKVFVVWV